MLPRNFTFGNLVLRRLKGIGIAAAIPAFWNAPFAGAELSMKRVIAGEWAFAESAVHAQKDYGDGYATVMGFNGITLPDILWWEFLFPLSLSMRHVFMTWKGCGGPHC
jgi:hypothetical protein